MDRPTSADQSASHLLEGSPSRRANRLREQARTAESRLRRDRRDDLLAWLRSGRFSAGVRCPRCSCGRVQGWGSFSGRQRYRCKGCRRTFSDLTGTPAAYIKKLELWPAFGRGMEEGESLRAAADRLGIHPSTAFRWRHRLLDGLRERDRETLEGWIECWLRGGYAESKKGQRGGLGRPPRTHAAVRPWSIFPDPGATGVLVAHDRRGHVVTGLVRRRVPGAEDLERVLGDRIGDPVGDDPGWHRTDHPGWHRTDDPGWHQTDDPGWRSVDDPDPPSSGRRSRSGGPRRPSPGPDPGPSPVLVVARARQALHGFEVFAHRRGGSVRSAWSAERRDPLVHTETARAYWIRLRTWMVRFRGVATRYLPNYLLWHRWLDRARRHASAEAVLRWPLRTERAPVPIAPLP